ncbi:MAG: hypothetical protein NZ937_09890, partial [Armatimonadetes bacterium]|nr:hypothetical protein [Armatimonadota bacterium]
KVMSRQVRDHPSAVTPPHRYLCPYEFCYLFHPLLFRKNDAFSPMPHLLSVKGDGSSHLDDRVVWYDDSNNNGTKRDKSPMQGKLRPLPKVR